MNNAFLWWSIIGIFSAVAAKSLYFSDVSEEEFKKLEEVARFLRNRLDEANAESFPLRDSPETEVDSQPSAEELKPPFEYNLPYSDPSSPSAPFAVAPSDPRYYQDFSVPLDPLVATPLAPADVLGPKGKRPRTEGPKVDWTTDSLGPYSSSPEQDVTITSLEEHYGYGSFHLVILVLSCIFGTLAMLCLCFGCYRLRKNAKAAADVDYPAYGVTGPNKEISPTSGDRRLAQSAQMYHYQHQKQQIIAMESMSNKERRSSISDAESEEENEEGDYTVYECPGLAPTGEMEVKNPLFQDDQTPASKQTAKESAEESRELPNLISFD